MINGYVEGILDNDLYKFTMQNAVCQKYSRALAKYNLINRDGREFPDGFGDELRRIIDTFQGFKLTKEQKCFLKMRCPYLNPVYLDFLEGYQFDPSAVTIKQKSSKLICYVQGSMYKEILWEVPLMATISQLYFEKTGKTKLDRKERKKRNYKKFMCLNSMGAPVIDFGTRRRYSLKNHDEVVGDAKECLKECLMGTSNVHLAMKHSLKPMGTNAHEWSQLHAALYGYSNANLMAIKTWADIYQGYLGTALPDTFTSDVFFKHFNAFYARLYDCLRHDSGSPFEFIYKAVSVYKYLQIDPMTKTLLFSDSLNSIKKVESIRIMCDKTIKDIYGIGTWFTNDFPDVKPLNIVIKLVACMVNSDWTVGDEWVDTVKLSDDEGKNTGKKEEIALCKATLGL
jgi:nicotinate phosphoribosyltransferase